MKEDVTLLGSLRPLVSCRTLLSLTSEAEGHIRGPTGRRVVSQPGNPSPVHHNTGLVPQTSLRLGPKSK